MSAENALSATKRLAFTIFSYVHDSASKGKSAARTAAASLSQRYQRTVSSSSSTTPRRVIPSVVVLLYLAFWLHGARKAEVVNAPTTRNRRILYALREFLEKMYIPSWLCVNGHMNSTLGYIKKGPAIPKAREILRTWDGGNFALDWREIGAAETIAPDTPTIFVVHGLNGHSDDAYVMHALKLAADRGWRAAAMNHRGCGRTTLSSPYGYNGAFTGDIRLAISTIHTRYPASPILACGYSLGANLLVKYLAEESAHQGTASFIAGAVVVSNPWNFVANVFGSDGGFVSWMVGRVYDFILTAGLKLYAKEHKESLTPQLHRMKELDVEAALSARELQDFDNAIIVPLWGYEDLNHYQLDASSAFYLQDVKTPLLCINAEDDPIIGRALWPLERVRANKNVIFVGTKTGGHLGWCRGLNPFTQSSWADELIGRYFDALLDTLRAEKRKQLYYPPPLLSSAAAKSNNDDVSSNSHAAAEDALARL